MIDEVLSRFFTYNPTAFEEYEDTEVDALAVWLRQNPHAWREPRKVPDPKDMTQGALLLVGEEGTGKTTALFEVTERLSVDPSNIILRFDFSHAVSMFLNEERDYDRTLDRFLHKQVETLVYSRGLWKTYEAALARRICSQGVGQAAAEIRSAWDYDALVGMDDEDLVSNELVQKALRIHRNSATSQGEFAVDALQHMAGHRTIVVVDNVDHLNQEHIPRVLGLLSTMINGATHAYIGLRPENEAFYPNFRQVRMTERIWLSNDGFMYKVAKRRLMGAASWVRATHPGRSAELETRSDLIRKNLNAVRADSLTSNLVEKWQNGNLRQMMAFILEIEEPLLDPNVSPGPLRGAVYDRVIRFSTPKYLHDIFDPRGITSPRYNLPFVFLPLRILAFLAARNAEVPRGELAWTLERDFDIPSHRVDEALNDLRGGLGNSGSAVRIIAGESGSPAAEDGVFLRPAGQVFIDQIVFSVDFLSWIYDQASVPFSPVETRGKRQTKFDKAVVVLREKILGAFLIEHPYMRPDRAIRAMERERLRAYAEDFNYGPGRWFLSRMINELDRYSLERSLDRTRFHGAEKEVRIMVQRLDSCYRREV